MPEDAGVSLPESADGRRYLKPSGVAEAKVRAKLKVKINAFDAIGQAAAIAQNLK